MRPCFLLEYFQKPGQEFDSSLKLGVPFASHRQRWLGGSLFSCVPTELPWRPTSFRRQGGRARYGVTASPLKCSWATQTQAVQRIHSEVHLRNFRTWFLLSSALLSCSLKSDSTALQGWAYSHSQAVSGHVLTTVVWKEKSIFYRNNILTIFPFPCDSHSLFNPE